MRAFSINTTTSEHATQFAKFVVSSIGLKLPPNNYQIGKMYEYFVSAQKWMVYPEKIKTLRFHFTTKTFQVICDGRVMEIPRVKGYNYYKKIVEFLDLCPNLKNVDCTWDSDALTTSQKNKLKTIVENFT
jgi:hypothetical protein